MPEVEIKTSRGNIPIDNKLYKKYSTAREIFDKETNNFNSVINITTDISRTLDKYDLSNIEQVKKCAVEIFNTYHDTREFYNNNSKIYVYDSGIRESIEKTCNNESQRNMLLQHLSIFTRLGYIIEHSILVTQGSETKSRSDINYWNYFFSCINVGGIKYNIEIEVRSMEDGQNQFRIQRIEIK